MTATKSSKPITVLQIALSALAAAALLTAALPPLAARAVGPITVTTTDGGDPNVDGECSLNEAITNANNDDAGHADCNSGLGADTIDFDNSLGTATISLTDQLPMLSDADGLVIDGDNRITISGDDTWRVFEVSGVATLQNLSVTDGATPYAGGGALIDAGGNLTIQHSTFSDNAASTGGGVYNGGTLSMVDSTLSGNSATLVAGGGLYAEAGTTNTITNSTLYGNSSVGPGGAVYVGSTVITFYDSTIAGNSSADETGAGLHLYLSAVFWYNSIFADSTNGYDCFNDSSSINGGYTLVETGCGLTDTMWGNIAGHDPQLGLPTGSPAFLPLRFTSPAIDAGSNADVPGAVSYDQAGNPRMSDIPWISDAGSGTPPIVDMGAYEKRVLCPFLIPRFYVDADATGGLDSGTSWADAFLDLQSALASEPECGGTVDIWVAEGLYKPTQTTDRSITFNIPPGIEVYGGFNGTESALGDRDWTVNVTVLSGDIETPDTTDSNGVVATAGDINGANSFHVVTLDGTSTDVTSDTVLDGFTITAGLANGGSYPDDSGGGLFCNGFGSGSVCSPLLSNLKFSGNDAVYGGGLFDEAGSGGQSSPTIENASFTGNNASGAGGGMHNTSEGTGSISSPLIINAVFDNNSSDVWGGGVANYATNGGRANPSLVDVTFSDNHAALGGAGGGGAMINSATNSGQASPTVNRTVFKANTASGIGGNGGAVVNSTSTSGVASPILTNTVFDNNSAAGTGGAMLNQAYSSGDSSPQVVNATFYNNTALVGGAILNSSADNAGIVNPAAYNSIFWANVGTAFGNSWRDVGTGASGSIDYSDVEGGCASTDAICGATNYNVDPQFVNRAAGDLRLQISSPIADAGSNTLVPVGITLDLAGALRFIDNPLAPDIGAGTPPIVDLGAYEHQGHLFADVPVSGKEWMEPWIEAFYNAGVTTGCGASPLIYCPEGSVTRASMAVFILRAKHGAGYVPPATTHTFSDMPVAGKEWMEPWVDQLYAEGITTGCAASPLRYCPEAPVTRAAMAVFLLRALEGSSYTPPAATHTFADLPVAGKEWMEPWVDEFYTRGITTGCGAGPLIYCPENPVTRAAMAVFIDRAYSLYP